MKDTIIIDNDSLFKMPSLAGDVGYNLTASEPPEIVGEPYDEEYWKEIKYIQYKTKVRITNLAGGVASFILPRSSLSKYNLTLANSVGLIDPHYTGEILCRFKYTFQPEDLKIVNGFNIVGKINYDKIFNQGDEIAQIVFFHPLHPQLTYADFNDIKTIRGDGGFGSTTK